MILMPNKRGHVMLFSCIITSFKLKILFILVISLLQKSPYFLYQYQQTLSSVEMVSQYYTHYSYKELILVYNMVTEWISDKW